MYTNSLLSKKLRFFLSILLALMFLSLPAAAQNTPAAERKIVRVGWYIVPGLQDRLDGTPGGYNYEYLAKLKQYTNWEYEFIYVPWQEAETKLINGEIDIVGDVAKTAVRQHKYAYCELPNGYSRMIMACRKDDTRFGYNDYASFNGIRVATVASEFRKMLLDREAAKHHFAVTYKEYPTEGEMFAALDKGAADVAIFSNVTMYPNYKVLSEWEPNPFYFVVHKERPDILEELNVAMRKIQATDIFMQERLFKKYFKNNTQGTITAFSREELNYLSTKPVIKVLAHAGDKPVSYFEQGKPAGIGVDYLQALADRHGLAVTYVSCSTHTEMLKKFQQGEGDICLQLADDFQNSQQLRASLTQPYLILRYGFVTEKENITAIKTVAVEEGHPVLKEKLQAYNLQVKEYAEMDMCLAAVLGQEVDAAVIDNLSYNQVAYHAKYQRLLFLTTPGLELGICLGISQYSPRALFSLLEKAANDLSAAELENIIVKDSAVQYHYTWQDYLQYGALFFLVIFVLAGAVLAALFWSRHQQRFNQRLTAAKERADQAKLKAEQANDAKSTFLSSMSHDLRTPLNGVIGYTELALQEQESSAKQDYLRKIQSSGQLLLDMVNDTLDLSRIESGKLVLKPEAIDEERYWEDIVTAMLPVADVKQVRLQADFSKFPRQMIMVDRVQVKKILINLLSNAIKYTPCGGIVTVAVVALEPPVHNCTRRISVEDTGIGMSKEFMDIMFEPFAQECRSESVNVTGTGLGLAIIKKIVALMGGTIVVESTLHRGTKFTVDLPLKSWDKDSDTIRAQEYSAQTQQINAMLNGCRFLLCEDNHINAELTKLLLKNKKVVVDWAMNGQEGVETFTQTAPDFYDLILMDIRMPVLNGLEATKAIRSLDRKDAKKIPIIAMTADAFEETIQEARTAGMDAYVTKPLAPDLFYKTLAAELAKTMNKK